MKIFITGGFGYLGGRLAQYLSQNTSQEVFIGSRKLRISPSWLRGVKVLKTDWGDINQLCDVTRGMDVIVHAAGMNAQDCARNPGEAIEMNGKATERLLNAAVKNQVTRFIYLSTAHVYDSPLTGIITEENPTLNKHSYATSHLLGEEAVSAQSKNIEGISIRLSNAFGAPTDVEANCWMLLANDLCKQAVVHGKMTLNSTGTQRRDFIAISEACRAIDYLLNLPANHIKDGLFNVSGEWSPTVKEMAELIAKRFQVMTGCTPELSLKANIEGETPAVLDYRMTKLIKTGFQSHGNQNVEKEIDRLIGFCIENKDKLQ